MKTIMNLDTQDSFYETTWSPDSGVYGSPGGSSSSGLTPHSDLHGQQFSPYSQNQNVYWTPAGMEDTSRPRLQITEEPQPMFRFRYQSEMHGTHGSLMGCSFEKSNKTKKIFPSVALRHFSGQQAFIRCTLYQVEREGVRVRQPHSHKLVIKKTGSEPEQCDPHVVKVSAENGFQATFQQMGIIHTARSNIIEELAAKFIRLEDYEQARELRPLEIERINKRAAAEAKTMNLNQVCLCFQAFSADGGEWREVCDPVFSQPINNIKSALTGELKICRVSTTVSGAQGGQEVYLLVEKVNKSDIKVRFYEQDADENVVWEKNAKILDVHHQYAIVIETPPYRSQNIEQPVEVFMELYRDAKPETKQTIFRSKPWPFKYKPSEVLHSRKRTRRDSAQLEDEFPTVLYSPASSSHEFELNIGQGLSKDEEAELMRILEEKMNEVRHIPDLGSSDLFGTPSLDIDSGGGPGRVPLSRSVQVKRLSGYLYFKLMVLLIQKYGTQDEFERVRDKVAKIFYHANKKGENFFFSAIEQGNVLVFKKVVQVLQSYRLEDLLTLSNDQNETCLHIACSFNRVSYLRLLLELGADPNHVDHKGNAPLHVCVLEGKLECLDKLLEASKSSHGTLRLDIENFDGLTALHLAVKLSQVPFIKRLLEAGASPSTTDAKTGDTILHTAVEQRSFETVRFVVESCGAADLLNATNHADHSPIQTVAAEESDDADLRIAKYLLQRGAKCTKIEMEVLERIKHVSDEEPVFKVPEVPKPEVPLPGPSFVIPQAPFEELQEVAEPIKLDEIARDELFSILGADQNWKKLAKLLGFEKLLEIWQLSKNPVKSLLDYIESSKVVDPERLCNYLQILEIDQAIDVIDCMIARQYKD